MLITRSRTFGEWVRRQREQRDLTQWALAERINYSFSTICKLETGVRRPSSQMAKCLMDFFEVPAEERAVILGLATSRHGMNAANIPTPASRKAQRAASALKGNKVAGPTTNLPAPVTSFIGREKEIRDIQALLGKKSVRLVTLLGPPGIGKTRLGVQVAQGMAEQFAGGVVFVFLTPVSDANMVLPAIAQALGVVQAPGVPLIDTLGAYLCEKHPLLVLDNFEHVLAARRALGGLLDACPHLKMLVTSRTALGLYGEHLFALEGLPTPAAGLEITPREASSYAAIALFEQRACAANSNFQLAREHVSTVADICGRMDGLPLGIEIAAALSKDFSPEEILARLTDGSGLPIISLDDGLSTHLGLGESINWSYNLLEPEERRLYQWLSILTGATTFDAIESICDWTANEEVSTQSALDLVGSLFNKSLLQKAEEGGEVRYYLLWIIREHAHGLLVQSGEEHDARTRHAMYYTNMVERARPHLMAGGRGPWLQRLDADYAHIQDALAWCFAHEDLAETGLRMAGALEWYWYYRSYFNEGKQWLTDLLRAADSAGVPRYNRHRAMALNALGKFALLHFDYDALQTQLSESLEISRSLGDEMSIAYALTSLGAGLAHGKLVDKGMSLVEQAVDIYRAAGDQWGTAYALTWLAHMYELLNDLDTARQLYERSLYIYGELGDSWGGAYNLPALGYLAIRRGDYSAARSYYRDALDLYRSVNDRWHTAAALRGLGDVALLEGRTAHAATYYDECLKLYRLLGDRLRIALMIRSQGYLALRKEDCIAAEVCFRESLEMILESEHKPSILLTLAAIATLAVANSAYVSAAKLSAQVDSFRERLNATMNVVNLSTYDRSIAHAREQIGERTFMSAYLEGSLMSLGEAVDFAKNNVLT